MTDRQTIVDLRVLSACRESHPADRKPLALAYRDEGHEFVIDHA